MGKTDKSWVGQHAAFSEALKYMNARQKGEEKSIYTPWPKFNDAATDGLEWNTLTVIGGRPGSGKTLIKDQIIRESFALNPHDEFRVLEFQFEMVGRTSAIREFSSMTGKTYKELCSAGSILQPEVLNKCLMYAKERVKNPVDIISTPLTVNQMREQIDMYMNLHKGKKTIVTLDHTMLVKRAPYQNNTLDMMFELGEFFTQCKRDYPILFIALSQLNRNIDSPERAIDGKYGNYILESDIFGSDAMLQHADMLIGINRPAKQKIRYYGPDRYIIEDDKTLVLHFLKARNGDARMSFFKAKFEQMKIEEMLTPSQQERR
jgi:replicative DNA helicase|tara:strand:+ start:175 stop:1131 length:957 start_codon:yes stop_codon:yes gene_type:complete